MWTRQRVYSHTSSSEQISWQSIQLSGYFSLDQSGGLTGWYYHTDTSVAKKQKPSDLQWSVRQKAVKMENLIKNSTLMTQNGNYTPKFQDQSSSHLFFLAFVGLKKLLPDFFLNLLLRLITQQLLSIEAVSSLYFLASYAQTFCVPWQRPRTVMSRTYPLLHNAFTFIQIKLFKKKIIHIIFWIVHLY